MEGRRGGSGGGTSGEERAFEKEEGFNLEGLGMEGKPSFWAHSSQITLPAIRVTGGSGGKTECCSSSSY